MKKIMKVEISEEGIIFCDKIPCDGWRDMETTCNNCPMDKVFDALLAYQVSLADKRNEVL